jgi:hypothetical protein
MLILAKADERYWSWPTSNKLPHAFHLGLSQLQKSGTYSGVISQRTRNSLNSGNDGLL